jgi:hypothetical protein
MITPGTVAAIAATLMSRDPGLLSRDDMWSKNETFRKTQITEFVSMAWDIALETEKQNHEKHFGK